MVYMVATRMMQVIDFVSMTWWLSSTSDVREELDWFVRVK